MKRIILLTDKATGTTIVFGTLKPVWPLYPELNPNAVENRLSRQKKPYEDEQVKIERKEVIR